MENILSKLTISKVYSAATIFSETGVTKRRNNRPCFALIFKYEGETVYQCGRESTISNANNAVILPQGISYTWECVKSGHCIMIGFECDYEFDRIISIPVASTDELLDAMRGIERKRLLKNSMYQIECIRDLYNIFLKLSETQAKKYVPGDKVKKLSPAIEFISNNLDKTIKNEDLASTLGVSTVYFRKLFTEVYGVSPMTYVKSLRIKKAKEMLRSDYGSLADVAFSLGYSNIYDFSRDFKKHTGVPPSKY